MNTYYAVSDREHGYYKVMAWCIDAAFEAARRVLPGRVTMYCNYSVEYQGFDLLGVIEDDERE